MVAECARVPGAPVVRMATSGGGFGGGGSIAFCTRRAAASCQCYYRSLLMICLALPVRRRALRA